MWVCCSGMLVLLQITLFISEKMCIDFTILMLPSNSLNLVTILKIIFKARIFMRTAVI